MEKKLFGRTKELLYPIWFSPQLPYSTMVSKELESLVEALLESKVPIEIGSNLPFWGACLKETCAPLAVISTEVFKSAGDSQSSFDLVQAHLLQALCSLGRERIDYYFLKVSLPVDHKKIEKAIEALYLAKDEGAIKHLGLCLNTKLDQVFEVWRRHDAFDVIRVPRNPIFSEVYKAAVYLAKQRNVGILTSNVLDWSEGIFFTELLCPDELGSGDVSVSKVPPAQTLVQGLIADYAVASPVLVRVRNLEECKLALSAPKLNRSAELGEMLLPYIHAYHDQKNWKNLLNDSRPWVKRGAERHLQHA